VKGGIAMELPRSGLAVALLTIGAGSQALAAGDQARGQTLFSSRCGACRALNALADPHISLAGLRGRAARSPC
jgi:cytochrome c5